MISYYFKPQLVNHLCVLKTVKDPKQTLVGHQLQLGQVQKPVPISQLADIDLKGSSETN